MKKLLAVACIAVIVCSCNNKDDKGLFTVLGEIKSATDQKIYLEELYFSDKQPLVLDTGDIKAGKFTLSAIAPEESLYRIRTAEGASIFFINEKNSISFTGVTTGEEPISGSFSGPANSSLKKLTQYMDSMSLLINNKNRLLSEFMKAGVKTTDSIFMATSDAFNKLKNDFTKYSFIYSDSAKSPIVALFAATIAPVSLPEFEVPLKSLVKRFPKHKGIAGALAYIQAQAKQAQPAAKPAVGEIAPDITMNDVNGKSFSLSSLRGKYVLVDFWASWCGPCREENPNVVAAFNQFNTKNFTVLGVSLDKNKQAWLNAIKEDKLNWQQISDLQYWSSAAVPLYGLDGIPYNVLIDPQGKIIATSLVGNALQNKLADVLK